MDDSNQCYNNKFVSIENNQKIKSETELLYEEINNLKRQLKVTEDDRDSKGQIATTLLCFCMQYANENSNFKTAYEEILKNLNNTIKL